MNSSVNKWYSHKIGYVLQLAVPYYEELTVRQNLFFAAHMRLPKSMSHTRKFERVEQIIEEVQIVVFIQWIFWQACDKYDSSELTY